MTIDMCKDLSTQKFMIVNSKFKKKIIPVKKELNKS